MILSAKWDFENLISTVITAERLTLEPSRALLRHENFHGKTKMSKIEKDKYWVDESSRRLEITFKVICRAKLDFQIFNPAAIAVEGPTLQASRAF